MDQRVEQRVEQRVDQVGGRSAIVVPIQLPDDLETIRLDHVANARLGVPAHVTVLFPFVRAAVLQPDHVEAALAAVQATPAFAVEFREARTFAPEATAEGVVWLAPEPAAPFIAMTEALVRAFPDYLPYGGVHDTVIPHLTLANVDVDIETIPAAARPVLPFGRRVLAAALLIEDDAGRWRIDRELPLGLPVG